MTTEGAGVSRPDRQEILTRAAAWMHARGWKEKLAKRRDFAESLFDG